MLVDWQSLFDTANVPHQTAIPELEVVVCECGEVMPVWHEGVKTFVAACGLCDQCLKEKWREWL